MNDDDEMGPGWDYAIWEVQVSGGFPMSNDTAKAPMKFGTPNIMVGGEDGLSDLQHPLIYGPVILRSGGGSSDLIMQVPAEMTRAEYEHRMSEHGMVNLGLEIVRWLHRPDIEFGDFGEIRAEGFEQGPDGALRLAVWEIEPYRHSEEDDSE